MLRFALAALAALCSATPATAAATITVTTNPADIVATPSSAGLLSIFPLGSAAFDASLTHLTQFGITFSSPTDQTISYRINSSGGFLGSFDILANTPQFIGFSGFGWTDSSVIFYHSADLSVVSSITGPAAVPEPATWAMLLIGFGLIGGALRMSRRRYRGSWTGTKPLQN